MATESTLPPAMSMDLIRRLIDEDIIGTSVTRVIIDAKIGMIDTPLRIIAEHLGDQRTIDAAVDVLCGVTGDLRCKCREESALAHGELLEDAWRKLRKYMRARVSCPTPDFIVNMMDNLLTLDPAEATEALVDDESNADSCGGCHQRDEFAAGRRSLSLRVVRDLLRAHGYLGHEGVQHVRLLFANDAREQANHLVDLLAAEESEATDGQD